LSEAEIVHTIDILPERVLGRLAAYTIYTWIDKVEYSAMVYGSRNRPATIRVGSVVRGTHGYVRPRFEIRRIMVFFHTHPPGYPPIPSIGDIVYVLWLKRNVDMHDTLEAFAIGTPLSMEEGVMNFYMVTDWEYFERVVLNVMPYLDEYWRYIDEGGVASEELVEAQNYIIEELVNCTSLGEVRYDIRAGVREKSRGVCLSWSREDALKLIELSRLFPSVEAPVREYTPRRARRLAGLHTMGPYGDDYVVL
jgi:hypothetical protein